MSTFYKVIRAIAYPIIRLVFRIKPVGLEKMPKEGGLILCCNHTSFTDVAFLIIICRRQIYFMAKSELFKNRFVNWLFTKMGAFAVQRGSGGAEAIEHAVKLINEGKVMGIFPEGTRSRDGTPKAAKSGVAVIAAKTKAPILPVAIYRKGKIAPFRKNTIRFGDIIKPEELDIYINSRTDLKQAANLIMGRITQLWEAGHGD